jgi:23S rRNA pseudouridine2605 synthase
MAERVQKILAQWGIASRRRAEEMIVAGRVRLNGKIVQLGQKADPEKDHLEIDGKKIEPPIVPKDCIYWSTNPLVWSLTCKDPQNRPTVIDLLPDSLAGETGFHPVGRLDINTTGALLLTNDGQLTSLSPILVIICPKPIGFG